MNKIEEYYFMAFLDLLKTVDCPVSADGHNVKNSRGVTVAVAVSPTIAQAMADLINLAMPAAEKRSPLR